jgi:hypothetical protein
MKKKYIAPTIESITLSTSRLLSSSDLDLPMGDADGFDGFAGDPDNPYLAPELDIPWQ